MPSARRTSKVEQAIRRGLSEIRFSDHAPLVTHEDARYTMSRAQLPEYLRTMKGRVLVNGRPA